MVDYSIEDKKLFIFYIKSLEITINIVEYPKGIIKILIGNNEKDYFATRNICFFYLYVNSRITKKMKTIIFSDLIDYFNNPYRLEEPNHLCLIKNLVEPDER